MSYYINSPPLRDNNNDELEKKIDNLDIKVTELLNKFKENETRKNIR